MDENVKAFVVYMNSLSLGSKITIHLAWKAQLALLLAEKVIILAKYLDFADVFSKESAEVLPKRTGINKDVIELEKGKQSPYESMYSLGPMKLKILKTYIETNLANGFIRPSKSPADAPILFVWKLEGSFCLCFNYWGLNNLMIKNRYPLPLIGESLDWLKQAKCFTQLDLTSAYQCIRIQKGDK